MTKIDYCYHTHTFRCGHAKGKDEEYVLMAIKKGIKTLGFSDHVFLPGLSQPGTRGEFEQLDDYIKSINYLKEKYKDQIEIHLGFECEYFPEYLDYYRSLKEKGIEYLILGQHFVSDKEGKLRYVLSNNFDYEIMPIYVDMLIKGMETGLFSYVAHPDSVYVPYAEMNDFLIASSYRICRKAKELNLPLEINLHGLLWDNKGRMNYANENFFKIAKEIGNSVIVGVDAHEPQELDYAKYDFATNLIDKLELDMVSRLKLK